MEWTEAQIKAVLKESATDERRKAYGLSPGNLARMVLDARHRAKNKHIGSSFDSFLEEEGMLEEVNAAAKKALKE